MNPGIHQYLSAVRPTGLGLRRGVGDPPSSHGARLGKAAGTVVPRAVQRMSQSSRLFESFVLICPVRRPRPREGKGRARSHTANTRDSEVPLFCLPRQRTGVGGEERATPPTTPRFGYCCQGQTPEPFCPAFAERPLRFLLEARPCQDHCARLSSFPWLLFPPAYLPFN